MSERTCPVTEGPCRARACADEPCGRAVQGVDLLTLMIRLSAPAIHADGNKLHLPVRLVINGIAHPVEDVWFEPGQDGTGAICIGDRR